MRSLLLLLDLLNHRGSVSGIGGLREAAEDVGVVDGEENVPKVQPTTER
jgi:hypothetical protein